MKKYILPLLFMTAAVSACNRNTDFVSEYFNTANLITQVFTVQTDKDTTLKTTDGIIISIPSNSIKVDGNTVTLQVKEALSLREMLRANLTTQAGKDMLSSDGMFSIGTKEQSTITGVIHIKVPAIDASKKMRLYKGLEKDGKIDWQSPTSNIKTVTPLSDSGEVFYKANCISCHAIDKTIIGGALAWMDKREGERLWPLIENYQKLIAHGDGYANCIFCRYRSNMTIFENILSHRDIDAIARYVDKVSREEGIPETFNPNKGCDSCDYYHEYYHDLQRKRDSLVSNNGAMAVLNYSLPVIPLDTTAIVIDGNAPVSNSSHVDVPYYNAEYYQFDINTFGWYNLDCLLKEWNGLPESSLIVKVTGGFTERIKVYLAIPSFKVFTEGGFLQNRKDFGFDEDDGKTRLPQGADAFIIAVGEQNEKLYYTQRHFITDLSQTVDISLKESDKASILASFESLRLNRAEMTVQKTKNFEGIKGVDDELKTLKGKLSNCSCMADPIPTSSAEDTLTNKQRR
jgi:mono/diheme cytochrome c family protein